MIACTYGMGVGALQGTVPAKKEGIKAILNAWGRNIKIINNI